MPAAQDPGRDPAYEPLTRAFDALHSHDYDLAVRQFQDAARLSPSRTDIRKNLAYTLLKTGESEAARQQFEVVVRLDPADEHAALEYAFLCFEAREDAPARKAEARRIFERLKTASPTAAEAFRNIDEPLRQGIARWRDVLASSKPTFSAHYELAQLAEQRDELELSAANYVAAFRLLPERKSVLLELARVEKARGNQRGAMSALLAASRGGEPRAAELAKEQLANQQTPARYPYVYEFREALALDPGNNTLHRELAWLLLSMSGSNGVTRADAEQEFQQVLDTSPDDSLAAAQLGFLYLDDHRDSDAMPLLKSALAHGDPETANRVRMALHLPPVLSGRSEPDSKLDPRILGERSYNAGFFQDALRYYTQARELNPVDASVALKLGWTYNLLHDDVSALHWFGIARRSSDTTVAAEAGKAWGNLAPGLRRIETTVWMYPIYSSRWSDLFGYGQLRTAWISKKLPFRPYVSVRLVGDVRRISPGAIRQPLSENAFLFGVGVTSRVWHGAVGWFEFGEAAAYLDGNHWRDARGGVSWSKTLGRSLAAEQGGTFLETADDSVFVSHFRNDLIQYSQNKFGYTSPPGVFRVQTFWNANLTFDAKRQYWANFAETGPGVRFHPPGTPKSVSVTLSALRGVYLKNQGNPGKPNFIDLRAGVWYAFTK